MKNLILSAVVSCGFSTSAIAGSPDTSAAYVAPPVAPAAASVTDWSGFYAGGVASSVSGEVDYFSGGVFSNGGHRFEGSQFGVMAGYNLQNGRYVYGGEVSYLSGDATVEAFASEYTDMIDLKARVGYALGDALIYGVVGYSVGSWFEITGSPVETIQPAGINYGVGVDYLVTNSIFVGAEYLARDLSDDFVDNPGFSLETSVQSVQLRAGWNF